MPTVPTQRITRHLLLSMILKHTSSHNETQQIYLARSKGSHATGNRESCYCG